MTEDQHSLQTDKRSFRLLSRSTPRLKRWRAGFGRFVFLMITGAIVSVSSERMFWYWSSNPLDHFEMALYYGAAAAAVLWVIQRFKVNSLSSLLLVAPIFAYMVEGIITPIPLYRSSQRGSASGTASLVWLDFGTCCICG